MVVGVPRVWEKMQEKMMEVGKSNKGLKRQIGQWAKKTGLKRNQKILAVINYQFVQTAGVLMTWNTILQGQGDTADTLSYRIADKLAFQKVKQALGLNKCHGVYAAAAPMSKDTLNYFMSLDMRILEIYGEEKGFKSPTFSYLPSWILDHVTPGMSECSGPQLTNTHQEQKVGSIGKSFPGFRTTIKRVDDDQINEMNEADGGEICMTGRNVMMGYMGKASGSGISGSPALIGFISICNDFWDCNTNISKIWHLKFTKLLRNQNFWFSQIFSQEKKLETLKC